MVSLLNKVIWFVKYLLYDKQVESEEFFSYCDEALRDIINEYQYSVSERRIQGLGYEVRYISDNMLLVIVYEKLTKDVDIILCKCTCESITEHSSYGEGCIYLQEIAMKCFPGGYVIPEEIRFTTGHEHCRRYLNHFASLLQEYGGDLLCGQSALFDHPIS